MRRELYERLSAVTDEEREILKRAEIDKKVYTASEHFIINDARLTRGKFDVIMRTHPRYTEFPTHSHTFCEIMIALSGKIVHSTPRGEIAMSAGDILFLNKHTSHSISVTDTGDVGVNIIVSDRFAEAIAPELVGTVFDSFFRENARREGAPIYLHFKAAGEWAIENLIENLICELSSDNRDEYATERTLSLLLYTLSERRGRLLVTNAPSDGKESERRLEIISYIRTSYRTASLTELAEQMYISPQYLSRITVKYFGKGFKELLLDERINRATSLLRETDLPISRIIKNLGYENESYFHREFKKRVGKTPLELRKRAK